MLLEEFSTIFDRPEKVKKLREYILSLAVRGKLVEQDENDEPASVLLERIREEKDRLVKEKKIKKEKPLPEISEDEIPYELPKGWEFIKIQNIAFVTKLAGFEYTKYIAPNIGKNNEVKLIKGKNIRKKYINLDCEDSISLEVSEQLHRSSLTKKCLLTPFVGSLGNIAIFETKDRYHLGANVAKIEIFNDTCINVEEEYLLYYFMSPLGEQQLTKHRKATAQESISMGAIRDAIIGVPPLNEQKKIVEKVDYLMEFCDKLEAQLEKKVKYGSLSAKSVLNSVSNCGSYEELEAALRFIIENFKDLTLADGAIGDLKNAILSLAIKGKLVPQDESDEPASVLLERIREEKERLVKEKKIKKEKPLPEISDDEIPYELPNSWEWVRLGCITNYGKNISISPENIDDDTWVLELEDIEKDSSKILQRLCFRDRKSKSTKLIFKKDDVLYCKLRPYLNKVVVVDNDGVCSSEIMPIRGYYGIYPKYLMYALKRPDFLKYTSEITYGTKMPRLGTEDGRKSLLPLPPLNEQKRIVEKVDKLMKVCDELELRIEKSKQYSEKLMESIFKNSFKA